MKRRKFLKLLGCSPFMFLAPGVFLRKKPVPYIITPDDQAGSGRWELMVYPGDMEFINHRDFVIEEIARAYKIPKSILSKR